MGKQLLDETKHKRELFCAIIEFIVALEQITIVYPPSYWQVKLDSMFARSNWLSLSLDTYMYINEAWFRRKSEFFSLIRIK